MPAKPVFQPRPNAIEGLFGRRKAVIGVIHSLALPGSPGYDGRPMQEIVDFAVAEATRYRELALDRIAFEHDVLREWAVAARVHDDPARLTAVDRTRPVPATIARGVELAARLALERSNDGDAWTTLVDSLSDATAHASWRAARSRPILPRRAASSCSQRSLPTSPATCASSRRRCSGPSPP